MVYRRNDLWNDVELLMLDFGIGDKGMRVLGLDCVDDMCLSF